MSYILDALRKAERDRNLGRVPTLEDVTQIPPVRAAAPLRGRRVLTIALLIFATLALMYVAYVYWRQESATAGAPHAPAESVDPLQETVPAPVEESVAPGAILTDEGAILDPGTEMSSLDQLMDVEQPREVFEESDETQAPASEAEEEFFEVEGDPAPTRTIAPSDITPPPLAAIAVPAPPLSPPSAPSVPTGPTLLRDMPSDYRSAFPQIRIDVHVHDADPARRWTLINGKKYLEGSTMAEGPRVVQITAEGMVFDYRGQQVLVPLNR